MQHNVHSSTEFALCLKYTSNSRQVMYPDLLNCSERYLLMLKELEANYFSAACMGECYPNVLIDNMADVGKPTVTVIHSLMSHSWLPTLDSKV